MELISSVFDAEVQNKAGIHSKAENHHHVAFCDMND
jgi:hypothetical protein